jgi:zinc protease
LKFELPDMLFPRRLPIGRADIIKTADRKQLKSFYDTWYRPENMILVMVGDVSTPLAQGLIASRFSDLAARGSAPVAPPETGTIDHRGLKVFYHHEPESGGTTVSIETVRASDPAPDSRDLQQRQILASMADRIVQYRLDARLKSPGAAFTSAAVGSGVYLGRIRYAEMTADSRADNWQQTLAALEQELRRAKQYGFGQAEVDRVKKETLKQLDDAVLKAPTRNSTALARGIIGHLARNRVFQSPLQERDVLAPVVANATVDDLNQRFRDNWPEDHRLVLVSGNASLADAPSAAAEIMIRNAFLASAGRVVAPPRPKAVASFPYLPVPVQSGAVASREDLVDLGITRIQFDNGVRLHVKQTDYKANEVLANLIFGKGKSSEPESLPGLALLAQATVNESGLGGMSTDELDQGLAGKSTEVDFRIDESRFSFVGETVSDEIELLFQLLYAHLTDPGFRSDALTLSKQRLHQRYLSSSRAIDGMMHIHGRRFLAGGDSRFGMPPLTQINAIGLDDVRRWIAPQLAHAPVELSVVGDVDVQRVVDLAGRYLGSLPPRLAADIAGLRSAGPSMPVGQTRRIQVDTQIPKAMVVAAWQTDDFWDIHRTRRLSVLADVFSERLRQRISERLGASYSPYAFNRSSRAYTGYGVFQAHISVAPNQAATVLQEVRAIAHDLASEPIAGDELDRALDPILNAIDVLRQTNGYWLNSVMTGSARHPQQYEWARSFVDDYAAVTAGELEALAARYLTEERAAAIIITPDGSDRMSGIGSPKTDAGGQEVEGG